MKVAIIQNNPVFGDIEQNVKSAISEIGNNQFDLLVLPELFATGYQFRDKEEALSKADKAGEGYTFETIKELAAQKEAAIVYGFPELAGDNVFNSALAVLPDGSYHLYQKTHLFDTEKDIYTPGQTGFITFQYKEAKIGIMICFDWRFPESARRMALDGAHIICHPANLVMPHCPQAMIIRALENNVFTITADRIGEENRTGSILHFIGKSRIIDPNGKAISELGEWDSGFISADIDLKEAENKKITAQNDLFKDRRPEFY